MVGDMDVQQLLEWKASLTVRAWENIGLHRIGYFQRVLIVFQNHGNNFDIPLFVGANDWLAKLRLNVIPRIFVQNFWIFVQNFGCWWFYWHWCFDNFDFLVTSFTFHNDNVFGIDGAGCIWLRWSIQEFDCWYRLRCTWRRFGRTFRRRSRCIGSHSFWWYFENLLVAWFPFDGLRDSKFYLRLRQFVGILWQSQFFRPRTS